MSDKKPYLRVHFIDQTGGFNARSNAPIRLLSEKYNIIFDPDKPDILFYSSFGWEHLYHKDPLLLFWTGENEYPDFNTCDYAISHLRDSIGGKNFWWPCFMKTLAAPDPIPVNPAKRPFASFLASHSRWHGGKLREEFTRYLIDHYKRVDCPGRVLHNIDIPELEPRNGQWLTSKRAYIGRYKFNIAFENSDTDGYITEKLTDCFVSNTVPIYWGGDGNTAPFPKDAMIYANDYPDFDSLLARIKEVDENDELYMSILKANPFHNEEFLANVKNLNGLRNFLFTVAHEALNRRNPKGCYTKRPVGNIHNIVNCILKKEASQKKTEQAERIGQSTISNNNQNNAIKAQVVCNDLKKQQEDQDNSMKFLLAVLQLPRYKRHFFWIRILSHLLPWVKDGIYKKEKKRLRKLIAEIENYLKNNQVS